MSSSGAESALTLDVLNSSAYSPSLYQQIDFAKITKSDLEVQHTALVTKYAVFHNKLVEYGTKVRMLTEDDDFEEEAKTWLQECDVMHAQKRTALEEKDEAVQKLDQQTVAVKQLRNAVTALTTAVNQSPKVLRQQHKAATSAENGDRGDKVGQLETALIRLEEKKDWMQQE